MLRCIKFGSRIFLFVLVKIFAVHNLIIQGSHRLEKYLNIQDCLEKSLKI